LLSAVGADNYLPDGEQGNVGIAVSHDVNYLNRDLRDYGITGIGEGGRVETAVKRLWYAN
jgi:hypothetical protein